MEEVSPISSYNNGSVNPETGDPSMGVNYPSQRDRVEDKDQFREDFRKLMVVATPINILFAEHFAKKGDNRLKEKILGHVAEFVGKYNMFPETAMHDIDLALSLDYFTQDPVLQEMVFNEAFDELQQEGKA